MTYKKLKLSAFLLLLSGGLHAQESVNASGGKATGSGGTANYTIGQVVYTTNTGTTGSVAHGVQQHYDIFVLTGIDFTDISLKLSAYPNPATNFLNLKIENNSHENWSYQLYNLQGEMIEDKKIVSHTSTISMEKLPSAVYFLKVIETQNRLSQQAKTFKIIKN